MVLADQLAELLEAARVALAEPMEEVEAVKLPHRGLRARMMTFHGWMHAIDHNRAQRIAGISQSAGKEELVLHLELDDQLLDFRKFEQHVADTNEALLSWKAYSHDGVRG